MKKQKSADKHQLKDGLQSDMKAKLMEMKSQLKEEDEKRQEREKAEQIRKKKEIEKNKSFEELLNERACQEKCVSYSRYFFTRSFRWS
ncbi:YqkE family protein [Bacillus subtilis subsp. subtilis]